MWCFRFLWSRNIYICLIFFFSQVISSYSLDHNWMNCTQDLYYCLSSSRNCFSDLLRAVCLLNFARRSAPGAGVFCSWVHSSRHVYVFEKCWFQIRPPPQKGGFFGGGGLFFGIFFHEFLRWGHKILHTNSNGLRGPSGKILANRMPFPDTNRILNFNFCRNFFHFVHF